jgi:hypothetical protein
MSMVSKVKSAGNASDIPKLHLNDYLKRETQNERAAAMKIVNAICERLSMSMEDVDRELSKRADGNWNHPGEPLNLKFLRVHRNHNVI